MDQKQIQSMLTESAKTLTAIAEGHAETIAKASQAVFDCLKNGNKVLLAGNGGSATQAAHIAAEFTGRYKLERKALPAIALTTDIAALTAIGNDYGFETIFSRQLEALGAKGDVLIVLSTSGNSPNIVKAVEQAKKQRIIVIGLLGKDGGALKGTSDIEIIIPSTNTPRIQEAHITIMHIMCELVENKLFEK